MSIIIKNICFKIINILDQVNLLQCILFTFLNFPHDIVFHVNIVLQQKWGLFFEQFLLSLVFVVCTLNLFNRFGHKIKINRWKMTNYQFFILKTSFQEIRKYFYLEIYISWLGRGKKYTESLHFTIMEKQVQWVAFFVEHSAMSEVIYMFNEH